MLRHPRAISCAPPAWSINIALVDLKVWVVLYQVRTNNRPAERLYLGTLFLSAPKVKVERICMSTITLKVS